MRNPSDSFTLHYNRDVIEFNSRDGEFEMTENYNCAYCLVEVEPDSHPHFMPIILTDINHVSLDGEIKFCHVNCLEDWIIKYVVHN